MAYENYRTQQPAAGYGQSGNSYGNANSYGQAGNPYDQDESYGGNPYTQGQYDRQGGYEMNQMNEMNGSDPNRILTECRQVDAEVDLLDAEQDRLKLMQAAYVNDPNSSLEAGTGLVVTRKSGELLDKYRALVVRMKRIKQDKESGNPRNSAQVGRVDRKVKQGLNNFQRLDTDYRKGLQERMQRDYRIVRPDASDAEVREAVQDPGQQVFSQALINSDRRGDAQSAASAVRSRHTAIQKIESDMIQLAAMFQDLDALVVQQEAQVTHIDERGEQVNTEAKNANIELDGAVTKARSARKKKWICLGIAVAIVVVIVIVVVVVVEVTKK